MSLDAIAKRVAIVGAEPESSQHSQIELSEYQFNLKDRHRY